MSKAMPERVHPLRLAHYGESLSASVALAQMPRLAEILREGANRADVVLHFGHDDGGQACVRGSIGATLAVLCQRCLEPMEITIEREICLALVRSDEEAAALHARYDALLVGDEPVSLPDLLEDELILALPNYSRHPRGACEMPPGANAVDEVDDSGARHDSRHGDAAGEPGEDNPFSVLESLKPRNTP